jgi:hypothetical protein
MPSWQNVCLVLSQISIVEHAFRNCQALAKYFPAMATKLGQISVVEHI